ncbi:hypothetical protein [Zavarzinia sp. CC-PAN008]|uniref:hypothetical protein n=1 Tax=Zavarzinia sp. CC-PAN008 TaxID=3243332 RepID=UPI003F74AA2A
MPPARPSLRLSEAAIRFGIPEPALRERVQAGRVEGFTDPGGSWHVYLDERGRPAEPPPPPGQRRRGRPTAGTPGEAADEAPGVALPRPLLVVLGLFHDLSSRHPIGLQIVLRLVLVGFASAIVARFLYMEPGLPDDPLRLDFMLIGLCVVPLAIWEVLMPLDPRAERDRPEYMIVLYAILLSLVTVPVAITFRMILGLILD